MCVTPCAACQPVQVLMSPVGVACRMRPAKVATCFGLHAVTCFHTTIHPRTPQRTHAHTHLSQHMSLMSLTHTYLNTHAPGQVLCADQQVAFELQGSSFKLAVGTLQIDVAGQNQQVPRALLAGNTAFIFTNPSAVVRRGMSVWWQARWFGGVAGLTGCRVCVSPACTPPRPTHTHTLPSTNISHTPPPPHTPACLPVPACCIPVRPPTPFALNNPSTHPL